MKRESSDDLRNSMVLRIKLTPVPAKIILIGGGSASGKTTVAMKVCDLFNKNGISAKCVSMDNFYRGLAENECGETYNWDSINAFNKDRLIDCIQTWKRGSACWIPQHNFSEYISTDRAEYIIPAQIMIIEGIHALSIEEIVPLADLRLFITCDGDESLARRITRDVNERGFNINVVLHRYFTFVKPALHRYITPSQKNADYIIANPNNGEYARDNALKLIISEISGTVYTQIDVRVC